MLAYLCMLYQKHTVLRFILTGCLNTLFGYLVFSFFTWLGAHYSLAVFLVLLFGVLFNFYTYGNWVFYNNNTKLLPKFLLVYLFLYGIDTFSLSLMLSYKINIYIAQLIVTFPLAIFTYILTKDFVFRVSNDHQELPS